jgi:hypothetical protein
LASAYFFSSAFSVKDKAADASMINQHIDLSQHLISHSPVRTVKKNVREKADPVILRKDIVMSVAEPPQMDWLAHYNPFGPPANNSGNIRGLKFL